MAARCPLRLLQDPVCKVTSGSPGCLTFTIVAVYAAILFVSLGTATQGVQSVKTGLRPRYFRKVF